MNVIKTAVVIAALTGAASLIPESSATAAAVQQEPTAAGQDTDAFREKISRQQLDLQEQIQSLLGRVGDLTEIVPAAYNELHSQKDRIELALVGQKVKEQAIQAKIDELTKRAQMQIAGDPMAIGLQRIADQKQKDAQRLQELQQQKLASAADVDAAVAQAAEAVVHVEERKEAITAAVGGGILPTLTKELIAISLDIAQQEATLKALDDRLERAEKARILYREYLRLAYVHVPSSTQPAGAGR